MAKRDFRNGSQKTRWLPGVDGVEGAPKWARFRAALCHPNPVAVEIQRISGQCSQRRELNAMRKSNTCVSEVKIAV
jgi:hypothetical protein